MKTPISTKLSPFCNVMDSYLSRWIIPITCLSLVHIGCIGTVAGPGSESITELVTTVGSFDSALESLDHQSSDWQSILQSLNSTLGNDVQSSLHIEMVNLIQAGILASSAEYRCNVEFLRIRIEQQLCRLRNSLVQEINRIGLLAPIPLLQEIPLEPYISNAIPSSVDLSLDPGRRCCIDIYGFDLRSIPITVEVVDFGGRRNVNHALGIIGDLHMVLDLTDNGAALNENSRQIVFSWNQRSQSVIPVLSSKPHGVCSTYSVVAHSDTVSFRPRHTQGDGDFKSHGPWIRFSVDISVDAEGRNLYADYAMEAFESRDRPDLCPMGDITAAWGSGTLLLFSAVDPTDRILSHSVSDHFEFQYVDIDHQDDSFTFAEPDPFETLIFVGDTDGDEAGSVTGVTIYFREIELQLERRM